MHDLTHHTISRPEIRMVKDVAAPAIVDIKSPGCRTCPTNSGAVYVSFGAIERKFIIKFDAPADPATVTKLTDRVTFPAVVLVKLALSMYVVQFTAVYCVV